MVLLDVFVRADPYQLILGGYIFILVVAIPVIGLLLCLLDGVRRFLLSALGRMVQMLSASPLLLIVFCLLVAATVFFVLTTFS
jgi:hypothetical protein